MVSLRVLNILYRTLEYRWWPSKSLMVSTTVLMEHPPLFWCYFHRTVTKTITDLEIRNRKGFGSNSFRECHMIVLCKQQENCKPFSTKRQPRQSQSFFSKLGSQISTISTQNVFLFLRDGCLFNRLLEIGDDVRHNFRIQHRSNVGFHEYKSR